MIELVQKTWVYWVGLVIFGAALVMLFGSAWRLAVPLSIPSGQQATEGMRRMADMGMRVIPPRIFGSLVFLGIGAYMIKEGKK